MAFLGKLFGGIAGELLDKGAKIADEFTFSGEEKAQFIGRMSEAMGETLEKGEATVQARMEMVSNVIQAEMASGNAYTKAARPTVVYMGLLIFLSDTISQALGGPDINIDANFTYAWGGVVGVWTLGRTGERISKQNSTVAKLSASVTGNKRLEGLMD